MLPFMGKNLYWAATFFINLISNTNMASISVRSKNLYNNQEKSVGDYFLYSPNLNAWFRDDIVRRI